MEMKRPKSNRRRFRRLLNWIFFVILIGGVGAISWYSYAQTQKQTKWRLQEYQGTESTYMGDLEVSVLASATLQPFDVVMVRPEASGKVEQLFADVGDVVEKGDPLAGLDQEDLLTRLDTARAELSRQRAQLQLVRRGYTPRERQAYESSVESAELALKEAVEDLEHVRELHVAGFASDEELDSAEYAVEQAEQARDQAVDALNVLLEGSMLEEIQAAEAGYRAAEVAVRDAENSLGDAVIYSPMSGVVLERLVTEGSVVVSTLASFAQGDVMFTIGDLASMKALASVDENDIGSVKIGQRCALDVDAYPDETFEGEVFKIHPQADTTGGVTAFTVEIEVPNPDGRLMAGMSCEVEIVTEVVENILLVPDRAVAEKDERYFVFVVNDKDQIEAREITIGRTNYEETEVVSGLEEGEQVIVRGVPRDLLDEVVKEKEDEEDGGAVEVRVG